MTAIFHNPRCSKSRQALALLRERGEEPEIIEYLKTPLNKAALRELLAKLRLSAHEILRTKEDAYGECGLSLESTEAEILTAIEQQPILLERPIIVKDGNAVIGRPPENVLGLP